MQHRLPLFLRFGVASAVLLGLSAAGAAAQEAAPPPPRPVPAPSPPNLLKPEELQAIITIPDPAVFTAKLEELKKQGSASEQTAYEIQLLRAWQNRDTPGLKALATEEKLKALNYQVADSQFFGSEAQLRSFLALMQAVIASAEGDEARLRSQAGEALWVFPDHATMVAELITEYQREKALTKLVLPMETRLKTSAGADATLGQLCQGKKALLLYFWASWAAPSVDQLPTIIGQAEKLLPQGVVLAGINTEGNAVKAEEVRSSRKLTSPWLLEPERKPFVSALEIDDLPRMTLVTPEGKVLFNGRPDDPRLPEPLGKLGVKY